VCSERKTKDLQMRVLRGRAKSLTGPLGSRVKKDESADEMRTEREGGYTPVAIERVRKRLEIKELNGLIELEESPRASFRRGFDWANTGESSIKYPACQLLYWYRSNELWKNRRNPHTQTRCVGHPNSSSGFTSGPPANPGRIGQYVRRWKGWLLCAVRDVSVIDAFNGPEVGPRPDVFASRTLTRSRSK
jgi:hypothetical protein